MISNYSKKNIPRYLAGSAVFLLMMFFAPLSGGAQGMSLTVTPPLFQLSINPGEIWSSTVKVVNNNAFDITVGSHVMDFEAQGEKGTGKFVPLPSNPDPSSTHSLASWITTPDEEITISAEQTATIPFTVRVPEDAEPGGHYAAILVGNNPQSSGEDGPTVNISTLISSLLFINIEGDIVENGRIREFFSEKTLYQTFDASFVLRFENQGNVHLKPQGTIEIFNMWGKPRGKIPINQESDFGNVLPESIRRFDFEWKGEENFFEIGRYSAIATVTFGDEARQNIHSSTFFWIVPFGPVSKILGGILAFMFFLVWSIRRYIRKALSLQGVSSPAKSKKPKNKKSTPQPRKAAPTKRKTKSSANLKVLAKPIVQGVVDLRSVGNTRQAVKGKKKKKMTLGQYFRKYMLFFVFLIVLILGIWGAGRFLSEVLTQERDYEVTIKKDGINDITITSEGSDP